MATHSHLTQHHPSKRAAATTRRTATRIEQHARFRIPSSQTSTTTATTSDDDDDGPPSFYSVEQQEKEEEHSDFFNYALLIVLYTLQGIPMGLSASIPFLIQQKIKLLAASTTTTATSAVVADTVLAATTTTASTTTAAAATAAASRLAYKANAIFALCSWPFSLKLLWAPIVDACFFKSFGRRKSWLVPAQTAAGLLMVMGANFVERQLGLDSNGNGSSSNHAQLHHSTAINVQGVTAFFFVLYFLMATQDIAVDGWALTMLSKKNRGRGPVCNSIGQNIGYFLSFVGFLALNDAESSETLWRPLLGLPSNPTSGLVSLQSFIRCMGYLMLITTTAVALFKRETPTPAMPVAVSKNSNNRNRLSPATEALLQQQQQQSDRLASINKFDRVNNKKKKYNDDQYSNDTYDNDNNNDDDKELDASEIGLKETYHRLWAVCKLPAVRWLFLVLLTYRLPTALSDNVKFLKAVEYGLSKSTTALLSPTVILPLGILVPIVATKIWHGHPFRQFMSAYKVRVTLTPLVDVLLLWMLQQRGSKPTTPGGILIFWGVLILSTALQAIVNSLQFNAQMTFFAHRVDPAIGGSYMTLLNTAANLGGTWPASMVLWMVGRLTEAPMCRTIADGSIVKNANGSGSSTLPDVVCTGGRDPYFILQLVLSGLGCLWIATLGGKVKQLAALPDEAWRTHLLDDEDDDNTTLMKSAGLDVEQGGVWTNSTATTTSTTAIPYPRSVWSGGGNGKAWWQNNSSMSVKDSKGE